MEINQINGFKIGDKVRLKDGDGRPHIIKSFEIDGIHGWFIVAHFEDETESMLSNISLLEEKGLDEAAEKCESYYDVGDEQGYLYTHKGDIADAFRAGAKWMAEQGVTTEQKVGRTPLNGPNGVTVFLYDFDGFQPGDKVIVQIRKK